ncbi:hypothetical protein L6164_032431 [Bauhinia variegata]|uniref:Uncharacterized protein n=1 Tax=Bauhinia variegata TaxID=167791 RepID=A0ACB9KNW4_BAUVA|nr:hypothetical protein L6164_032431 [Bauhinia variegata]
MATGKVESMAEASQATGVAPSQMAESIPWSGVFLNDDSARYSKEQGGKATTKRQYSNPTVAEKLDPPYPEDDLDSSRMQVPKQSSSLQIQDRLGYDQPSKAVEWLIKRAVDAIAEFPSRSNTFPDSPKHPSDEKRASERTELVFDSAELDLFIE